MNIYLLFLGFSNTYIPELGPRFWGLECPRVLGDPAKELVPWWKELCCAHPHLGMRISLLPSPVLLLTSEHQLWFHGRRSLPTPCVFPHEQEINYANSAPFPIWSKEKSCGSLIEGCPQESEQVSARHIRRALALIGKMNAQFGKCQ